MSRDTSFYYSFLALPTAQGNAIVTVWDACRAIDDAVDEAADGAQAVRQVAFWRDEIARVFDGGAPESAQGRALQPVAAAFVLPRRSFEDLIDGVQMDLGARRYETFDDLREYCWRVASTVGLICLNIFGCRHPGGRDYAMNLGLALQVTLRRPRFGPAGNAGRTACAADGLLPCPALAGERARVEFPRQVSWAVPCG